MFIDCVIIVLICIVIYLIIGRLYKINEKQNQEQFVPLSENNIKPPPYKDVFLTKNEKDKYNNKNIFEEKLSSSFTPEPVINDIPINIIYDKLTEN